MKAPEIPAIFLSAFIFTGLPGQEPVVVPKLEGIIQLDGKPDEEIWNSAREFPFTMHMPVFGKEPSGITEFRMFFDDKYLYAAGWLYYSDVSLIARAGKQRDYFSQQCDWFGILLDSFYDRENGVAFYTNPNGLRFDGTVKNDASMGENDLNISWNTFWDVATSMDEKGWYAEFRIPLSSLRFQESGGSTKMGLMAVRFIPGKSEMATFPPIDPKYGQFAIWKPSLSSPVVFYGMTPERPFYISPYVAGGVQYSHSLNKEESAYQPEKSPRYNAGMDMKIGLTNNLTLDLTANTDFAQVEADDEQINLTRYSLFSPRKDLV